MLPPLPERPKLVHTAQELRAGVRAARTAGRTIGLVPTMGALHEGHLSLVRAAQAECGFSIVTIFVNPTQFAPHEDFDKYPRTFQADCDKLAAAGVDVLFAPTEADLYPEPQEYTVEPPAIQNILDGEFRPGHFRGVATVVLKLFNIVQPQAALFGKKDYQQLMVIRNMARQLALPIAIIGGETVRAADGLALSSRNGYLSAAERAEAPRLYRELQRIRDAIRNGEADTVKLENAAISALTAAGWKTDYVAVRQQSDLAIPKSIGIPLVALAASRLGSTRLIDNIEI